MRITNIQKNELSDIFRNTGLNLLDFETSGQYKEFKIKFKHEYFSFSININESNKYVAVLLPVNDTSGHQFSGTWEQIKRHFSNWIHQIAVELNTPTGWETFQSENFLNAEYEELNQDFSDTEKMQARQSIINLKVRVESLELPADKINIINKKLDDLSIKVDEFSKFDWKSLFIGTVASLIMTLVIPPQASGLLWEYIKTAFSGLRLKS